MLSVFLQAISFLSASREIFFRKPVNKDHRLKAHIKGPVLARLTYGKTASRVKG
jgi:hypothetical protein